MISIYIGRDKDKRIERFKVIGHSGYAKEGEDIVCAAVSAIVQTAVMGIGNIANIDIQYHQEKGYASFSLPYKISHQQMRDAQIILGTMLVGLKNIEMQYSSFVRIDDSEVK